MFIDMCVCAADMYRRMQTPVNIGAIDRRYRYVSGRAISSESAARPSAIARLWPCRRISSFKAPFSARNAASSTTESADADAYLGCLETCV